MRTRVRHTKLPQPGHLAVITRKKLFLIGRNEIFAEAKKEVPWIWFRVCLAVT